MSGADATRAVGVEGAAQAYVCAVDARTALHAQVLAAEAGADVVASYAHLALGGGLASVRGAGAVYTGCTADGAVLRFAGAAWTLRIG